MLITRHRWSLLHIVSIDVVLFVESNRTCLIILNISLHQTSYYSHLNRVWWLKQLTPCIFFNIMIDDSFRSIINITQYWYKWVCDARYEVTFQALIINSVLTLPTTELLITLNQESEPYRSPPPENNFTRNSRRMLTL